MMGEKKAQNVYWKEREKVGCKGKSDRALLPNKRSLAPMNPQGSNGRDGLGKVNQRKTADGVTSHLQGRQGWLFRRSAAEKIDPIYGDLVTIKSALAV